MNAGSWCRVGVVASHIKPHDGRLRVYLAEDSPIIVNLLTDLLEAEDSLACIGHASSAETAIRETNSLRPDVVVVDLSLGDSSGFEVIDALSSWPAAQRPLIAVLTNFASEPYRQRAMRLNVDYFFDKSREIILMLRTFSQLARSRLGDSAYHARA